MADFDIEFTNFMNNCRESLEDLANRLDILEDKLTDNENKVVGLDYDVKDLQDKSTK